MPFDQPTLKSTVAKLGGKTKITVDFLGRKKGAIEIPRTTIKRCISNIHEVPPKNYKKIHYVSYRP